MKVSTAIAEILVREGVDTIFGYPRNAVLEQAAARGIRTIIVRQERTGLHMADIAKLIGVLHRL
ncbi:MAG: thiamine pyrophosphate-binding protein, partial [Novosphingobium sp.]